MISKAILLFIAGMQLLAGGWAASIVFEDPTLPISTLGMMGMLGSLFHSVVLIAALKFRVRERRIIALLLPVWHMPEALLIATLGMGVPEDQRIFGILMHATFSVLAIVAWYLERGVADSDAN